MNRRLSGVLLTVACLVPFLRLGLGEIQPWDESLYAIRADACLKFSAWLDQTQYAVGHLYSATHPPLGVWLIAISKYLLGNSTFAVRLPIALAASASIYLLWLIVRTFTSRESALLAAVSLSTADLFLELSHRAQMECLFLFFSFAAIYLIIMAIERERGMFAVLAGMVLGLGLLTKFGEAFFIIPFLLLLPWVLDKPRTIRYIGLTCAIALVITAPWFLIMASRHPDYWNHVFGSLETLRAGNYAPSKLAWWYYLNRLFVGLPLIVLALFVRGSSRLFRASLVWLAIIMIVLQVVGTRMPHFAFLLFAPGVFLISSCWDGLNEMSSKRRAMTFTTLCIAIAWSASEQVRLLLANRLSLQDFIIRPGGVAAFGIIMLLGIIARKYTKTHAKASVGFAALLLAIAFAHIFSTQENVYQDGAEHVASIAKMLPAKSEMVIIHPDFPNEEFAPQLAYYTGEWTLGWIPGKTSQAITRDRAASGAYIPDSSKEFVVVSRFENRFYHRSVREATLWDTLTRKLRQNFSHEEVCPSYTVYF